MIIRELGFRQMLGEEKRGEKTGEEEKGRESRREEERGGEERTVPTGAARWRPAAAVESGRPTMSSAAVPEGIASPTARRTTPRFL